MLGLWFRLFKKTAFSFSLGITLFNFLLIFFWSTGRYPWFSEAWWVSCRTGIPPPTSCLAWWPWSRPTPWSSHRRKLWWERGWSWGTCSSWWNWVSIFPMTACSEPALLFPYPSTHTAVRIEAKSSDRCSWSCFEFWCHKALCRKMLVWEDNAWSYWKNIFHLECKPELQKQLSESITGKIDSL